MDIEDIPTFEITDDIVMSLVRLEKSMARCRFLNGKEAAILLRKCTTIRSINSSLAIEGVMLKDEEVADIMDGKNVIGPFDEMVQAKNTVNAYRMMSDTDAWSIEDFLRVADEMTFGLIENPGFRACGVGVFKDEQMIYKAPDSHCVEPMMRRLLDWGCGSKTSPIIKAAVAHYYIEKIHPFEDCNGRMGRLWCTKVLVDHDELFRLVPLETCIHRNVDEYYDILARSDGDCTEFILFCIECLTESFDDVSHIRDDNMTRLLDAMGDGPMTLKELMDALGYSSRSRFMESYLNPALSYGLIVRTESGTRSRYQRYRRIV